MLIWSLVAGFMAMPVRAEPERLGTVTSSCDVVFCELFSTGVGPMTEDEKAGLSAALNEASLLGFEVDKEKRIAAATFNVLSLPQTGLVPDDRRVQMIFRPVGKVVASLRNGSWDDPAAEVVPFQIEELLEVVTSFGELPIYGWEFFDVAIEKEKNWIDRLSVDWSSGDNGHSHSISVFQEAGDRILDLRVWFDCVEIYNPTGERLSLGSFIAGGERWWNAFHAGDDRTIGFGMIPLKK